MREVLLKIVLFVCIGEGFAFGPSVRSNHVIRNDATLSSIQHTHSSRADHPLHSTRTKQEGSECNVALKKGRRDLLQKIVGTAFCSGLVGDMIVTDMDPSRSAWAADKEPTIWKSGKTPIVAGQKAKDKNDVNGTRKDPSFLRSVANCKNQCENTTGPDGYARAKEECLSDCQDICCTTYEQCTFGIVPRI